MVLSTIFFNKKHDKRKYDKNSFPILLQMQKYGIIKKKNDDFWIVQHYFVYNTHRVFDKIHPYINQFVW